MGASTGHRAEGENQKKWLLVRPLEAQFRILRGRLLDNVDLFRSKHRGSLLK